MLVIMLTLLIVWVFLLPLMVFLTSVLLTIFH